MKVKLITELTLGEVIDLVNQLDNTDKYEVLAELWGWITAEDKMLFLHNRLDVEEFFRYLIDDGFGKEAFQRYDDLTDMIKEAKEEYEEQHKRDSRRRERRERKLNRQN